jgi:hypothetical protein
MLMMPYLVPATHASHMPYTPMVPMCLLGLPLLEQLMGQLEQQLFMEHYTHMC